MKIHALFFASLMLMACNEGKTDSQTLQNQPNQQQSNTTASSDKNNSTTNKSNEELINDIRAEFAAINNDKSLVKKYYEWENDYSINCGYFVANVSTFKDNQQQVRKVILYAGGDGAEVVYEFFYKNNQLFFVYEKSTYYPPMEGAEPQITETRIYLDNERVFEGIYAGTKVKDKFDQYGFDVVANMGIQIKNGTSVEEFNKVLCSD